MLDSHDTDVLPPGLALAWGVRPSSRRGPKPAHTVEQIVEAAMELADAEGFAAASMPNIAAQLGVTTNALYRYVSSKEELVVLLADAAWGPPPYGLVDGMDWREAARAWTHAVVDRYQTRTWLLDVPVRGGALTPNLLRWREVLLEALSNTRMAESDVLGCAVLLDDFARSTALRHRSRLKGATLPEQAAPVQAFLMPLLNERGYPLSAALLARGVDLEGPADAVDFGIDRLVDGIVALVAQRRNQPP